MQGTVTVGFLLFWAGLVMAYIGAVLLPMLTKSQKAAFWTLATSCAIGWAAMVGGAAIFGYGGTWLNMPASLMFGAIAIILSAVLIHHPSERQN